MSIYKHLDYRLALKTSLEELKPIKKSATLQNMAEYCRVQKTYLSKVLNHGGNLNSDQLYLACDYLKLNSKQTEYVQLLHNFDQCSVDKRKKEILQKVHAIQKEHQTTHAHINVKTEDLKIDAINEYYSDPYHQLIHMFLTIERFRKDLKLIADKTKLPADKVQYYVEQLQKMQIITYSEGKIKILQDNLHLPANSSLMKAYRSLTRLQALELINRLPAEDAYTFTVAFSTDKETKEKIHQKFLDFLKDTQKLVGKSKEEELYQINFDFLKWS